MSSHELHRWNHGEDIICFAAFSMNEAGSLVIGESFLQDSAGVGRTSDVESLNTISAANLTKSGLPSRSTPLLRSSKNSSCHWRTIPR